MSLSDKIVVLSFQNPVANRVNRSKIISPITDIQRVIIVLRPSQISLPRNFLLVLLVLFVSLLHIHYPLVDLGQQFLFLPRHAPATCLAPVVLLLNLDGHVWRELISCSLGHPTELL